MRTLVSTLLALTAVGAGAHAAPILHQSAPPLPIQAHGPMATVRAIYQVETAFERRSKTAGTAAAYAEFMDPVDSVTLTGGTSPRGARAISTAMGEMMGAGVLAWRPEEVFASTGDMGAVVGRWTFTPKGAAPPLAGRYVTVWRKTPAGAWKAAIDVGVPDR